MIKITAFGSAYKHRKSLKALSFRYNPFSKHWYRNVNRSDLNKVLGSLYGMEGIDYYWKDIV